MNAAEETLRIEVDTKDYPRRLMHVFELACELGYRITVSNGKFCVRDEVDEYWYFPFSYTDECRYVLASIEQHVDYRFAEKKRMRCFTPPKTVLEL